MPGLILSLGLHPLIGGLPNFSSILAAYPASSGMIFLVEVATLGMISSAAALPVYHVAQGLSLPWLTFPARFLNRWRFNRKYRAFAGAYGDRTYAEVDGATAERLQKLFIYLSDFPVERDADGLPRFLIRHSTRVGNITATYERYLDTRYGVNAEAVWEQFHLLLPSEVRKELDATHAPAMGTLLAAAAGWAVAVASLALWMALVVGARFPRMVISALPVSTHALLGLFLYGVTVALLFNYLTRVAHREYGRLFRACVDVHIKQLAMWLDGHTVPLTERQARTAEVFRDYASALAPFTRP